LKMQNQNSNSGVSGQQRGRRLVLHFDINNTILMKDTSKNLKSVQINVARIIAKSSWGRVTPSAESDHNQGGNWALLHDQLAWTKPDISLLKEKDRETESGDPVELVSYMDYLNEAYPLDRGNAEQNQAIITDRLLSFARAGGLASKFKNISEKMLKALNLPKGAKEELNYPPELVEKIQKGEPLWDDKKKQAGEDEDEDAEQEENAGAGEAELTEEQKLMMQMFGEGKYHLIPAFFRTLIQLKKQKREFAVVYRTFGKDLDHVIWEFNQFCCGNHPCYSGRNGTPLIRFDGYKLTKDLRIRDPLQKGLFFRFSNELSDAKLLQGTLNRKTNDYDEVQDLINNEDEFEDCNFIQDHIQIYQSLQETLKKFSTVAIQDDYQNWKENDHHREVAKLLLVDQADYSTQHIFFDDNADQDEDCIVDVRDAITKEIVPYQKFINRYVIKVEPHRAILEPDYFIKMIEVAEQNRDEEIERVEAGMDDPAVQQDDKQEMEVAEDNEWQRLQELPNEEYLMKTVLPVLYQGMKIVDQQRPVAPLEYLALYLLKHQDQIKLPVKPVNSYQ